MEIAEAEPEHTWGILDPLVATVLVFWQGIQCLHNTRMLSLFVERMSHSQHAGIVIPVRTFGNLAQT